MMLSHSLSLSLSCAQARALSLSHTHTYGVRRCGKCGFRISVSRGSSRRRHTMVIIVQVRFMARNSRLSSTPIAV